jgi:hypothetical protein
MTPHTGYWLRVTAATVVVATALLFAATYYGVFFSLGSAIYLGDAHDASRFEATIVAAPFWVTLVLDLLAIGYCVLRLTRVLGRATLRHKLSAAIVVATGVLIALLSYRVPAFDVHLSRECVVYEPPSILATTCDLSHTFGDGALVAIVIGTLLVEAVVLMTRPSALPQNRAS